VWLIGDLPDGYVMLAIAGLVLVAAIAFNGKNSPGAAGFNVLLGIAGVAWAVASYFAFKSNVDDSIGSTSFELRPAVGLWLAGIGSILVVVGGMAAKATASSSATATSSWPSASPF
jgi:hypothetical protein